MPEQFDEFKDMASRLLKLFSKVMKKELFDNSGVIKTLTSVSDDEFKAFEFNELNEKEYKECTIRTDSKYLAEVKRMEMNTFLEAKRKGKYMRFKDDDDKGSSEDNHSVISKKRKRDESDLEIPEFSVPTKLLRSRGGRDIDREMDLYSNSDCVNKPLRSRRNKC
jgi:hypothetical protein